MESLFSTGDSFGSGSAKLMKARFKYHSPAHEYCSAQQQQQLQLQRQPRRPLVTCNTSDRSRPQRLVDQPAAFVHNTGKVPPLFIPWFPTGIPERIRQLASSFCNHLEGLIPTPPIPDQHPLMQQGNLAPVSHECPPQPCQLHEKYGPLPDLLQGTYIRNGPNQQFAYSSNIDGRGRRPTHPFDGDGMLHAVTFRIGSPPSYCCRYVHSSRFLQEQAAEQALFTKTFSCLTSTTRFVATAHMSLAVLRHMLGLVDLSQGMGLANTALVFHHGKLLALAEDDLTYALDIQQDGDLVNRGRYSFKGSFKAQTMTSHPKVDPQSGEMIILSYHAFFCPYLTFSFVSRDGIISKIVPIHLEEPCMIHDFALTPNFIIFPETQLVFHLLDMIQGKEPIKYDPKKRQRFGVLQRNAKDGREVQWFDVPGCNCFHIINAWEEKCKSDNDGLMEDIVLVLPNLSNPGALMNGNFCDVQSQATQVRLHIKSGHAIQGPVLWDNYNDVNLEMGSMNENFQGVQNKFVYMGIMGRSLQCLKGIVKLDMESHQIVARRVFNENYFASEPMFVPKESCQSYRESGKAQEDEGCLLCFLHHDNPNAITHKNKDEMTCELLVLDPQSPTLEIMASIKLPRRVPYGFHGLFVPHCTE